MNYIIPRIGPAWYRYPVPEAVLLDWLFFNHGAEPLWIT